MLCDEYRCPNVARVTLYGRHMNEHPKVDVCTAHQYIYKHLGYKEAVLNDWAVDFEHIPSDTFLDKLRRKFKKIR